MRILQISSAENFGGGEQHLCDLAAGLQARGHDLFAAIRPSCKWKNKLRGIGEKNIVEMPLKGSADLLSAVRLARYLSRNRIDIVHAHTARDYAPAAVAARLSKRAAFVLTRHVLFPMSTVNALLLRNTAAAIAVSTAVETGLRRIFPDEKIVSIPNGIAMSRFRSSEEEASGADFRAAYNIPADVPLVGTVGELKPLKGQEDFILAAAEVVKSFKETRFLIVGKDNSADRTFKRRLRRMAKVLGLESNLTFLDWVEDTVPLLSALDVFVSASHSESFGLAILEAMASGTPVVATETAGARELAGAERTDLLVGIQDPVELATAISRILRHPARAEEIGRENRRRAALQFSLEQMLDSTEDLYRRVLKQTD